MFRIFNNNQPEWRHCHEIRHNCFLRRPVDGLLPAETSFTQAVKEGYHDIKDSVKENFGAYTGNDKQDALNFAEHRKEDLKKYHDAVREARDDYREARHRDQKAYLKYHKELPEKEDIQADLQLPKADF